MATKAKSNGNGATLHEERAARVEVPPQRGREVQIKAPNLQTAEFRIIGTAPYMQARFAAKAMQAMMAKHAAGSQANKSKNRAARDFNADYEGAKHKFKDGTCGIPAGAFRNAMVSACRLVNFKMTIGKLSVFVEADGLDEVDGTPLVRIKGTPERTDLAVRNDSGVCDIRVRPMWREWSALVRIRFDADQFSVEDVANLLARVGMQIGIGEGRPDSKESCGMGYGLFKIEGK